MLLLCGNDTVDSNWSVREQTPTGFCRVYYVLEGNAVYKSTDQEITLLPGYAYVLPSVVPYSVTKKPDIVFSHTFAHIDPSPYIVHKLITLDTIENPLFFHYLETFKAAINIENLDIIFALTDIFMRICAGKDGIKKVSEKVNGAIRYISQHLNERIDIRILSDVVGYNPNYFINLFKKETGVSPYRYLIRRRLQQSLLLLREGKTVAQAAEEVGYCDANGFSRAFRDSFGVTPGFMRDIKPKTRK